MSSVEFIDLAPRFEVADVTASLKFYVDALGFTLLDTFDDPPVYAMVKRGPIEIHLQKAPVVEGFSSGAYIWVRNIGALVEELTSRGTPFLGPFDRIYKMREVIVRDPDRNEITFGE
ncbi:MAG: hypothetical protein QOI24_2681 [Acidobacteriota bacterium]|jgi:catechol 2,3-dioxygenase-like lactoylglutathione lyase family enzyme|nr:hypothetical protein [Acidobacteriota bacterium]